MLSEPEQASFLPCCRASVSTFSDEESNITRERKQLLRQVSTYEFQRQKSQVAKRFLWCHGAVVVVVMAVDGVGAGPPPIQVTLQHNPVCSNRIHASIVYCAYFVYYPV